MSRALMLVEAAGFGLVILLIWADELFDLPHALLGAAPTPLRLSEATLESVAVLGLGALTSFLTLRVLRRLRYLESFLVLCAWCHRVRNGQQWVPIERFLADHDTTTSHGICPECEDRLDRGEPKGS
jgi:hypothetical protein